MRVLFCALRWDYKERARGDSFEYTNFWDTLQRLDGVEAEFFPFDQHEADLGRDKMNRMLLERVEESSPDLVFFFFFTDEFDPEVVAKISSITTTVNWFADDQWRFQHFSRHWAPYLTWVATTYKPAAEGYRRLGHKGVIETQWACNHFMYRPIDPPRDLDLTFIGQPHGTRPEIIKALRSSGLRVDTWGLGWEQGRLSQPEMIRVFSRSKINLNLSNASGPVGLNRFLGLFLQRKGPLVVPRWGKIAQNFTEYRAKKRDQIKGRNFEIPGCCTFLLTSAVEGLDEYFVPGKEIVTFTDTDDLIKKANHYLNSEEERESIAQAGYRRTLDEHTYEKRFTEMFKVMGLA